MSEQIKHRLKQSETKRINDNRQHLLRQYGFIAGTTKTIRQNVLTILKSKLQHDLQILPPKLAYHDLTIKEKVPFAAKKLLGLGMKFCISKETPSYEWLETSQERLTRQIRLQASMPPMDAEIPKLWCRSNYDPPKADAFTEAHIKMFFNEIKKEIKKHKHTGS